MPLAFSSFTVAASCGRGLYAEGWSWYFEGINNRQRGEDDKRTAITNGALQA